MELKTIRKDKRKKKERKKKKRKLVSKTELFSFFHRFQSQSSIKGTLTLLTNIWPLHLKKTTFLISVLAYSNMYYKEYKKAIKIINIGDR